MTAAIAVVLSGPWPVAHVHAHDDHQIVHQHVIADGSGHAGDHADDHDAGVGQPDHTAARILAVFCDLTAPVTASGPPRAVGRDAQPAIPVIAPAARTTWLPTHDPPLRFVSSPAPPAIV